MDLTALIQAVPELAALFGVLGAIAWFRKQDRETRSADMAAVRNELAAVRMSALPPEGTDPDASGRLRAVGAAPYRASAVEPLGRIEDKLGELCSDVEDLGSTMAEEIRESRSFRESAGQRVTALETDVKWLRRGKGRDDTLGGGKS